MNCYYLFFFCDFTINDVKLEYTLKKNIMLRKISDMKLFVAYVILSSVFCYVVSCESAINENENEAKSKSVTSVKTKRGALHYGYGGNALTYTLPLAHSIHKNYAPSVYSHIPGLHKNVLAPATTYALGHGGSTVHSYNVNYPKYNLIPTKPIVHFHPGRPAVIPSVPVNTIAVVPAAKPFIPVSYPIYSHRYPVIVQKPLFFQKPIVPASAAFPIKPSITQLPNYHPILTTNFSPLSSVPVQSFSPQLVPAVGTTLFNIQPDGWRPLVINPTVTTSSVNTPSVSLLPPISAGTPIGTSPSAIQPSFTSPKHPNNFYLTPSEGASLEQLNQIGNQQSEQSISNEELAQTQGNFIYYYIYLINVVQFKNYSIFIIFISVKTLRTITAATAITTAP